MPLLYLDANVLLPEYLRAVTLDLADAELVRVHWGEQILAEVQRNLLKPKLGMTPASVDKLLRDMRNAFPDALVLGSAGRAARGDVLDAMLQRFENPAVSRDDLLATLDASNCRAFATALGNAWGLASSGV